ncbi:methyltransferase domain-containing protein [Paragemmobacter ruber]|uniref:methyltransferase domain-containing protein n=1 Tax=Paragemmobacter ruber TaxID=1985673 RepID=UPI002E2ACFDC|nr:methyltransferase domain-containing protein [Rhodobacter ruber]
MRLRPALDLLAQLDGLPEGDVVDLGCGNGAVAADLRARFCVGGARRLIGVDSSPAMVAEAEATGLYDLLEAADAADWAPRAAPALIFSNAALHWLPDHARLMPRLARLVAPGGLLAVQMPRQYGAPSHRFLRDIAGAMFPDRFTTADWRSPVMAAGEYWRLLSPLGQVEAWETEYVQRLDPSPDGHPVRRFTESTAMRPFLARLDGDEAKRFVAAYEEALASAYPALEDGAVLFPFKRVFFTLRV